MRLNFKGLLIDKDVLWYPTCQTTSELSLTRKPVCILVLYSLQIDARVTTDQQLKPCLYLGIRVIYLRPREIVASHQLHVRFLNNTCP